MTFKLTPVAYAARIVVGALFQVFERRELRARLSKPGRTDLKGV